MGAALSETDFLPPVEAGGDLLRAQARVVRFTQRGLALVFTSMAAEDFPDPAELAVHLCSDGMGGKEPEIGTSHNTELR